MKKDKIQESLESLFSVHLVDWQKKIAARIYILLELLQVAKATWAKIKDGNRICKFVYWTPTLVEMGSYNFSTDYPSARLFVHSSIRVICQEPLVF